MLVKEGSLIHEETPLVFLLSAKVKNERCEHCFELCEVRTCSRCRGSGYCGRICQRAAWSAGHSAECSRIAALPPERELPDTARLIARILIKLKKGGDTVIGWYSNKSRFRCFSNLMSHYSTVKEDEKRMEHTISLYGVLLTFFKDDDSFLPTMAEFTALYGRMVINSFNILDHDLNTIGTGIYLGASTIDHSCKPNCVATFIGTTIKIRTIEDIHEFAWEKVSISYIDLIKIRLDRRKELKERYYFDCDCPRCSDKDVEEHEIAMTCSSCSSDIPSVKVETDQKCCGCYAVLSEDKVLKFKEALGFTRDQLESMKDIAYVDTCEACLRRLDEGNVTAGTVYRAAVLDALLEANLRLNRWEEAYSRGRALAPLLPPLIGHAHPQLGLLHLTLAKLSLHVPQADGVKHIDCAGRLLRLSHGVDHPLYREALMPLARQLLMESN